MSEQFDINHCTVSGIVQKIWDRNADIFLRLAFLPEPEKPLRYLTARLRGGMIDGQLVSLQPGDRLRLAGCLADEPYTETIQEFLWDARKRKLQDTLSDKLSGVSIKRVGTRLDVLELERLLPDAPAQAAEVSLSGVAARVWESSVNLMARLAVYDRHTEIIDPNNGNRQRPRRKPHYITVRFPESRAGEQTIHLKPRHRVRLSGALQIRFYRETLREVLVRNNAADRIGELDGIDPDEICAIRHSVSVTATAAIVMTSLKRDALTA